MPAKRQPNSAKSDHVFGQTRKQPKMLRAGLYARVSRANTVRRLTRDPAGLIPLKHLTYQVLLAPGGGEAMHGYAIMQAVSAMTEGREAILPGTLYAALARMVDEGLVTESTPKDDASGGPARRYYQRTSFGRAVARAESERLRALLDVARAQNMFGGPK